MDDAKSWLNEIYSRRWAAIFRNYCNRKFANLTDPEALMEDARQILAMTLHRMIENEDSSSLSEGFIMTSFRHAVTDCHRKKYGRGEPRAWLKAFGDLGKRLFELYCLAKMKRMEVLESVDSELSTSSEVSVKPQAEELLNEMDHRRECAGKGMQETSLQVGNDEDVEIPDRNSPEDG